MNNLYYAVNNRKQIFLLNKNDLNIIKTININKELSKNSETHLLKLSPSVFSLFIYDKLYDYYTYIYKISFDIQNYEISMNGIKWDLKREKNFINKNTKNDEIIFIKLYKDVILLQKNGEKVLNFIKPKELDLAKN